jgi:hypothetical protein
MDLPSLRHFCNTGIYSIYSDTVEALAGESWVPAIYTDKGWATADGASLLLGIEEWRHAAEKGQITGCDLKQHQSRDEGGQTAKAGNRNRAVKSRQITQAEG